MEKQDLVVKSQTGSGKTAAYGIPICEMIEWEEKKPQALILTPTRELAAQVREDITNIGRFKRIKAMARLWKRTFYETKRRIEAENTCRRWYTWTCHGSHRKRNPRFRPNKVSYHR